MSARRGVLILVVLLAAGSLAACAGDPAEVAARGADEVARHSATRWARLSVDGLSEVEYDVAPAFVDPANAGQLLDFDHEYGTTFTQRFVSSGVGDPMEMLRDDILANGARMLDRRCTDDAPAKRLWTFAVESSGDVLILSLTETPDGAFYVAALPSGSSAGSFRDRLDDARDRAPVAAIPPDPVCPSVEEALIPTTTPASTVAD